MNSVVGEKRRTSFIQRWALRVGRGDGVLAVVVHEGLN